MCYLPTYVSPMKCDNTLIIIIIIIIQTNTAQIRNEVTTNALVCITFDIAVQCMNSTTSCQSAVSITISVVLYFYSFLICCGISCSSDFVVHFVLRGLMQINKLNK